MMDMSEGEGGVILYILKGKRENKEENIRKCIKIYFSIFAKQYNVL